VLKHIDDLQRVIPAEVFVADPPQVGNCQLRARRQAGDVKLEKVRRRSALSSEMLDAAKPAVDLVGSQNSSRPNGRGLQAVGCLGRNGPWT
jgi:hypothetical protein